jgi:CTP synthase (UTP-ammonia lyase)
MDPKIVLFTRKLDEFVDALASTFPEIPDFNILRTTMRLGLNKSSLPFDTFIRHVYVPYAEQIAKKDERFFLNEDYTQQMSDAVLTDMNIVDKLKGVWKSLDEDNKNVIWQYLQVLVVLAGKCHSNT